MIMSTSGTEVNTCHVSFGTTPFTILLLLLLLLFLPFLIPIIMVGRLSTHAMHEATDRPDEVSTIEGHIYNMTQWDGPLICFLLYLFSDLMFHTQLIIINISHVDMIFIVLLRTRAVEGRYPPRLLHVDYMQRILSRSRGWGTEEEEKLTKRYVAFSFLLLSFVIEHEEFTFHKMICSHFNSLSFTRMAKRNNSWNDDSNHLWVVKYEI